MRYTSLLLFAFAACSPTAKKSSDMAGAYELTSQTMTTATATDSAEAAADQLKIYTEDFYMWSKVYRTDSVPEFGIGVYETRAAGDVIEKSVYGAVDSAVYEELPPFKIQIEKTSTGFKQVIKDVTVQGETFTLNEEYVNKGVAITSPLDGAWKLTRGYHVNGTDTITNRGLQYKVYGSGYFAYGYTLPDPERKMRSFTGFGKFEMDGRDHVKETLSNCNYPYVNGRVFDLKIEFTGPDTYRQIIQAGRGADVEEYMRMKK